MQKIQWEKMIRRWLDEEHGSVLAVELDGLPEDLRMTAIVVTQTNVIHVCRLVGLNAGLVFHDPQRLLDPAFVDKMLVV